MKVEQFLRMFADNITTVEIYRDYDKKSGIINFNENKELSSKDWKILDEFNENQIKEYKNINNIIKLIVE